MTSDYVVFEFVGT